METPGQSTENQNNQAKGNVYLRSAMTFGLIIGIVLVIYTLLLYMTNSYLTKNFLLSIIQWILVIGGLYWGIKSYRDQQEGGYITYGKSVGLGVLISVFVGVIMGIFTYLLFVAIDPGLMDESMKIAQEEMLKRGMSPDQVETATEMQRNFQSPILMLFGSILSFAFIGTILSLIISIFTKKEEPIFNQ